MATVADTGKGVQYISEDIQFDPCDANTGEFEKIKKLVNFLPPPS